jgi:hypothetical protein
MFTSRRLEQISLGNMLRIPTCRNCGQACYRRNAQPVGQEPSRVHGTSRASGFAESAALVIAKTKGSPMMGEPQTTRRGTDSASDGYMLCLIGRVGFEPTRSTTPTDFKSVASPVPPPPLRRHCAPVRGAELASPGVTPTPCSHDKWLIALRTTISHESRRGDGRIRTGDRGFADPCLATWPRHRL